MQIQIRSQLIWIYTVCKGRAYPGTTGNGLIYLCENSGQSLAPDKRGIHIIVFLFLHENICLGYSLESEVLLMSTITDVFVEKYEQEAHGPWLTHLSEIATADKQMLGKNKLFDSHYHPPRFLPPPPPTLIDVFFVVQVLLWSSGFYKKKILRFANRQVPFHINLHKYSNCACKTTIIHLDVITNTK